MAEFNPSNPGSDGDSQTMDDIIEERVKKRLEEEASKKKDSDALLAMRNAPLLAEAEKKAYEQILGIVSAQNRFSIGSLLGGKGPAPAIKVGATPAKAPQLLSGGKGFSPMKRNLDAFTPVPTRTPPGAPGDSRTISVDPMGQVMNGIWNAIGLGRWS